MVAIAVFVALLTQANGDAAVAVGSQVDTASPWSLLTKAFDWAKDDPKPRPGPQQRSGTAAGRDSRVTAAETRAKGGKGRPRAKAPGELGPYAAKWRERKSFKTGAGMQPGNRFDSRTAKRRADLVTPNSEAMQDAGGLVQMKVSSGRMNFRRSDGSFAEIDPSLRKERGRYRQKANNLQIDVATQADDPSFARFAVDGSHAVSAGIEGAAASPAVVEGSKVTYADVFRSIDVELLSLEDGLKETFILKSADAPTRFTFPLALTGLTARLDESGGVEFVDADGTVRMLTPAGFMEDSNIDPRSGDGASSDAVTYRLITDDAGGVSLQVVLDRKWVRDEARKFPIRVDPSYNRTASADTFADRFTPTADRSTYPALSMGTYDNGTHLARAYFKFNYLTSPQPTGYHTTDVKLNVFLNYQGTCSAQPFEVWAIRESWSPATLNWQNAPSVAGPIGTASPAPGAACNNPSVNPDTGVWVSIPMTKSVFDYWLPANYGLMLRAPVNTGTTSWKKFASEETAKKAYVSITYAPNVAPQVDGLYPEAGANVYNLRPELMAAAHDPDTWPMVELQYRFKLYNSEGGLLADSGELPFGVQSWIPPPGLLAWNKSYGWVAGVTDGESPSPTAPVSYFTTTVPQPLVTSTLGQNNEQGFDPNIANYTTSEVDAQVATHGPPLAVARYYNSRDPRLSGAFGAGWSSVYDLKVTETREVTAGLTGAVITYPEGVEVGFGRNPNGTWTPPLGRFAVLTSIPANSATPTGYKLIDKNGTTYLFEKSTGAGVFGITQIIDARGFTETFHYTGNTMDYVISASGRTLSFLWQPVGVGGAKAAHITAVTTNLADPLDPTSAQVWTYRYSGDRLDAACPPGSLSACSTYHYRDGSGYSTTVLDAGPRTYLRLRDAPGTTLPDGKVVVADEVINNQGAFTGVVSGQLGSAAGPLQSASSSGAVFDNGDAITVPWDTADNASAQSISLWFKTGTAGGVLYGFHSAPGRPATATVATYSPALYIGTDGKLRGQFYSGGASVPVTTAGPVIDNAWHFAVLTIEGGTQKLYLDGNLVGTLSGQAAQTVGRAVTTIGTGYLGGTWPAQSHYSASDYTGYLSPFTGQIAEVADFASTLTATEVAQMRAAAIQSTFLLDELSTPEGRKRAEVEYDVGAATVRAITDANGGRYELLAPTITGSSVGFRTAVILSDPAAYWRLADSGGVQANDDSMQRNYGNYDNVTLGGLGPFGTGDVTAATFNGTDSKLRSPVDVASGANALSISMWFKTAPGGSTGRVLYEYSADAVTAGASTSRAFVPALYIGTDGRLQGHLWNGAGTHMASPGAVNNGAWHHVVLAGSGTSQALYLDGARVAQATSASPIGLAGPLQNTVGAGYLGAGWPNQPHGASVPAPATFFNGQLAEVSVYRSGLLPEHVTSMWNAYKNAASVEPRKYVSVKHPTGETTTNVYDARHYDRVTRVVNTLGQGTEYEYDWDGYNYQVTDANGNYTVTGHDARGNVSGYTTCQDRNPGPTEDVKCSSEYFQFHLNAANPLTDPINDRVKEYRDGRTANAVDDNRYRTSYTYTAFGDLATVTTPSLPDHPGGRTSVTTYVAPNVPAPGGGYQPARLVASTKTPGNALQRFVYFSNGDLAQTISPLNGVTNFDYDGLGRVTKKSVITASQPDPVVTAYTYDGRDQVRTETGPARTNAVTGAVHQEQVTYTYDDDGNIESESTADIGPDPDARDQTRTLQWTYNAAGLVEFHTDARGKTTQFEYNLYGQKTKEVAPDGQVTEFTYDSEGRAWRTILKNYIANPDSPDAPASPQPADLVLESRAYDPAGRLASVTDAMGFMSEYTYFDNNLPATLTRRDTVTPACLVPVASRPASCDFVVESNEYDAASNLIARTINDGKTVTRFTLDAAARVEKETLELGTNAANDPSDRSITYTYDADDNLIKTVTRQGDLTPETIRAEYDLAGNLTKQIVVLDTGDRITQWGRDDRGLVTSMTDGRGKQSTYINDASGNQVQASAPQVTIEPGDGSSANSSPISLTGYNTFGEISERKDPNGNITQTAYDPAGHVASITAPPYTPPGGDPITAETTREYNDIGQLVRETDPLGHETSYEYDQLGALIRTTAPGGAVTRLTYTLNGNVRSTISPTGAITETTYDYLSRKVAETAYLREPAQTNVSTFAYGDGGWLAKQFSPGATEAGCVTTCEAGEVISYGYDNAGQVTSVVDGAGKQTLFSYDLKDRLLARTLADGSSTTRTYNAAGDLIATADKEPGGTVLRSTSARYDLNGQLVGATDALGHESTFIRDDSGVITEQVEPTGPGTSITSTFGYDAAGNRTRFTDGRGSAFLTTYNSWHLPATRVEPATPAHPDLADRTWTTSYDAAARPVRMQAPGGVVREREFDDRGNLLAETGTGAEAATETRTFDYDTADRIIAASAPGTESTFTWDDRGQLRATAGGAGIASFGYDRDGRMTSRTDAAGTTSYTYAKGRLSTITDAATAVTATYGYTADSQVSSTAYSTGPVRTYTYDDLQRLRTDTTTANAGGTETARIVYGYDKNDNLTSKVTAGLAGPSNNSYTYDFANRLTSWDNGSGGAGAVTDYAYDGAGNRTQIGNQVLAYDQRNRVITKTSPAETTTYTYSPRGTRIATAVDTGASTVSTATSFDAFDQLLTNGDTVNAYDALGRVITTGPSAGPAVTLSYTGLDNDIAADGSTTYARAPDGALLATAQAGGGGSVPGTGALALTDRHEDLIAALNPTTGAVLGSTGYDPLGKVTAQTGALAGRLGYQSELTDPATGAVDMFSRWYDPASGQFSSRDGMILDPTPVSAAGNGYGYLDGNPFAGTDPSGHCCGFPNVSLPKIPNPIPAITSTVSAVYTHVIKPVVDTTVSVVKKTTRSIVSGAQNAGAAAKKIAEQSAAAAKAAAQKIADEAAAAKERALAAAAKAKREIAKAAERARKQAAHMAKVMAKAAEESRKLAERLALQGVAITEKAAAGLSETVKGTLAAANATARFVDTHKATLAGVAVGIAVGLACAPAAAATGGLAAVGCIAAAGAAGSAVSAAISHPPTSFANVGQILQETALGAGIAVATLGAGKVLSPIASRAFAPALSRFGITPATRNAAAVTEGIIPRATAQGDDAARAAAQNTRRESVPVSCNSFAPGTGVLMADGATKPIEQIGLGDLVLAADPAADPADDSRQEAAPQRVVATITGDGLKDLVEITVDGETITATAGHPFWVTDNGSPVQSGQDGRWVDAGALQPGDRLLEPDGDIVTIDRVRAYPSIARVHNLTISGVHTYYILAGDNPVLVHNTGGCPGLDALSQSAQGLDRNGFSPAGRAFQKHFFRPGTSFAPPTAAGFDGATQAPGVLNELGRNALDDLLTDPRTAIQRHGDFTDYRLPWGGARFTNNKFTGFLNP